MTPTATPARTLSADTKAARFRLFEFRKDIPAGLALFLGLLVWAIFFGIWEIGVRAQWMNEILLPGPGRVVTALYTLFAENSFLADVVISVRRVLLSFAMACAIAVPLGILMGTFRAVEAFLGPFVSAWRYLPAPSFIPLLLMWFGAGEGQKLALLFIGAIWFLITLIADLTRNVPHELIRTSVTLGGNRRQVLRSVILPATLPGIVVAMRQILAVSWTYLVIAEITAADAGIGAMMMRAKRFLHVDQIMAGILVIGILGLFFDYLLRLLHRRVFHYLEEYP